MLRLLLLILTIVSFNAMALTASVHATEMAEAAGASSTHAGHMDASAKRQASHQQPGEAVAAMSDQLCEWVCFGGVPLADAALQTRTFKLRFANLPVPADSTLSGLHPPLNEKPPQPDLL